MKIIPIVLLGLLILPESIFQVSIFPLSVVDAHPIKTRPVKPLLQIFHHLPGHPIHPGHQSPSQSHTVVGGRNPLRTPLECDACEYLANGLNQTVLHNPKVISIVTTEIEQICQVLPSSVQQLCLNAAEQTAPVLLNHLGDFIATEGCIDLGVCHTAA
ncbi:hypothetical protein EBV26_19240 [bacterium]|nr:hypothetical protein [bacterium]